MFQGALKVLRRISDERVERVEGNVLFVSVEKFRAPELRVAEKILLAGFATRECKPLDIIGFADIIERWVVQRRIPSRRRNQGGQIWRKFLGRCPMIETIQRT